MLKYQPENPTNKRKFSLRRNLQGLRFEPARDKSQNLQHWGKILNSNAFCMQVNENDKARTYSSSNAKS